MDRQPWLRSDWFYVGSAARLAIQDLTAWDSRTGRWAGVSGKLATSRCTRRDKRSSAGRTTSRTPGWSFRSRLSSCSPHRPAAVAPMTLEGLGLGGTSTPKGRDSLHPLFAETPFPTAPGATDNAGVRSPRTCAGNRGQASPSW